VLVLDEATSRLDPATEETVDAAVAAVTRGRAVVVIAHRPATAARADRVVRLSAGATVPDGRGPGATGDRPEA